MADDEKFLVVPLGKKSKAITQTVSNDTAMEIMELLAEGPMSTSNAAEKLNIPLTTAQYNIEKLMEAGLVKVARTKYSEKGREVKLYEAMNRAIIILPGKTGTGAVLDALKRYILLVPLIIAASLGVEYLVPLSPFGQQLYMDSAAAAAKGGETGSFTLANAAPSPVATAMPVMAPAYAPERAMEAAPSIWDQASQAIMPYFQHAGVLFFAGCLLVILLLIVMEYYRYSKAPTLKK